MRRCKSTTRPIFDHAIGGVLVALAVSVSGGADDPHRHDPVDIHAGHETHAEAARAQGEAFFSEQLESAIELARQGQSWLTAWYRDTPPADRVTWAGMMASAGLALGVLFERMVRLQKHKIVPPEFTARFLDRLHEGKLDCGQALDHCELNPSPAARVALAAVRRWGRPPADLERAVALAHRVETERLRRNVGTLRRIAAITPLLGLLGTLFAVDRALEGMPSMAPIHIRNATIASQSSQNAQAAMIAWGPTLAAALTPLSVGIIIAALALVMYDGLLTRIEKLAGGLDRLGAEAIDAIALTAPVSSPPIALAHVVGRPSPSTTDPAVGRLLMPARTPHQQQMRNQARSDLSTQSTRHEEMGF
jgi:biopolymer transport protein ExbB